MPRNIPFPETEAGAEVALFHVQQFAGVNTRARRPAIGDNQFSWLENMVPIGDGNMRTLYSNAAPIFTVPGAQTIIYTYFFNIALIAYAAVFLSDGTAYQVTLSTGATVAISTNVNEFYAGGALPAAAQWTASGIVIVCESQNPQGYFAWDGATLFRPGQASPTWLNGGVVTPMPTGIHGTGIETYQSRVWVVTPPQPGGIPTILSFSAAGNGANFNTNAGGGSAPQQDASLRGTYTALKQSNGFLYVFGDSSCSVIANVQQAGSATSYQQQNVDPQTGTIWPGSVQIFGAGILFANPFGVHVLLGGNIQKISQDLDGIFAKADFLTVVPTASVAVVFGIKVYCLLIRSIDQTGKSRNFMCMWNGGAWWFGSQDNALSLIAAQELNSVLLSYGTDGANLFQLFARASATLPKTIQSKFFAGGQGNSDYIKFKKCMRFYYMVNDEFGQGVFFTGTIDSDFANASFVTNTLTAVNNSQGILQPQNLANQNLYAVTFGILAASIGYYEFTNQSGGIIHFVNQSGGVILWGVSALAINGQDQAAYGRLLGFTLGSISSDFTLIAASIEYNHDAPFLG